ncbi:unnamed protein product [Gadus morhua 'NCC']
MELAKAQAALGLPHHQLITETPTRFKTTYMRENRAEYMKNRAVTELLGMVEGATAPPASDQRAVGSQAAEDDPPTKKKTLASYFKKAVPASAHTRLRNRESIELEVAMYLKAPGPASEADPLEWWKQHEYHLPDFPNLTILAQLATTLAVHTAGCERGFSAQNLILTLTGTGCHQNIKTNFSRP